jgi:hypothetical protein
MTPPLLVAAYTWRSSELTVTSVGLNRPRMCVHPREPRDRTRPPARPGSEPRAPADRSRESAPSLPGRTPAECAKDLATARLAGDATTIHHQLDTESPSLVHSSRHATGGGRQRPRATTTMVGQQQGTGGRRPRDVWARGYTPSMAPKKKFRLRGRSAKTGRFMKLADARRRKSTSVVERIRLSGRRRKK